MLVVSVVISLGPGQKPFGLILIWTVIYSLPLNMTKLWEVLPLMMRDLPVVKGKKKKKMDAPVV